MIPELQNIRAGQAGAVLGLPGCGKSRAAKLAAAGWRRFVVFDPYAHRDAAERARGRAEVGDVWPRARTVDMGDLLRAPHALDAGRLALVVSSGKLDARRLAADFGALAGMVWHTGGGEGAPLVLVAEEAALYGRESAAAILRTASGGRHAGVALVLLCQSLGRLPIDARRHLSFIVSGPVAEAQDLRDLRARCGDTYAERVKNARSGELVSWSVGQLQTAASAAQSGATRRTENEAWTS